MPTWREVSLDFCDLGKQIEQIDQMVKHVRAAGAVNDDGAVNEIDNALAVAKRMVRTLQSLQYLVRRKDEAS